MMVTSLILIFILFTAGVVSLCCNYGKTPETAGQSCYEIVVISPGCRKQSGNYWIETVNGTAVQVYCNMEILEGGWERVLYYDSQEVPSATCPNDMVPFDLGGIYNLCTNNRGAGNITSTSGYAVTSSYSEVLGLISAFMTEQGHAFHPNGETIVDMNDVYVEGISLTINDSSGFQKHIHSVTIGDYQTTDNSHSCFHAKQDPSQPPAIVGRDNTCHIVVYFNYMDINGIIGPHTKPFGDNMNCPVIIFCRSPTRYFRKQLPNLYTSADHPLMLRLMSRSSNVIGLHFMDIYVR